MKLRTAIPVAAATAALFAVPASTGKAMTIMPGLTKDGLVGLAATTEVSPEAIKACQHFAKQAQRDKCQQQYVHKPKRFGGRS
jgi:hypothetical protein